MPMTAMDHFRETLLVMSQQGLTPGRAQVGDEFVRALHDELRAQGMVTVDLADWMGQIDTGTVYLWDVKLELTDD